MKDPRATNDVKHIRRDRLVKKFGGMNQGLLHHQDAKDADTKRRALVAKMKEKQ